MVRRVRPLVLRLLAVVHRVPALVGRVPSVVRHVPAVVRPFPAGRHRATAGAQWSTAEAGRTTAGIRRTTAGTRWTTAGTRRARPEHGGPRLNTAGGHGRNTADQGQSRARRTFPVRKRTPKRRMVAQRCFITNAGFPGVPNLSMQSIDLLIYRRVSGSCQPR